MNAATWSALRFTRAAKCGSFRYAEFNAELGRFLSFSQSSAGFRCAEFATKCGISLPFLEDWHPSWPLRRCEGNFFAD